MVANLTPPRIAIACGGTGGHLFPGIAVGECLQAQGADVLLMVSPKDVDQQALGASPGSAVAVLPAVGLTSGNRWAFLRGFSQSLRIARNQFSRTPPAAVLAMGGFTSAAPVLAGKLAGARIFLHEANARPGRANRWLAPLARGVFVNFPEAAPRLRHRHVQRAGMPVRASFRSQDCARCRLALGLAPDKPVLLVMGGSQGAHAINEAVLRLLPALLLLEPDLQYVHLTGTRDLAPVRQAYLQHHRKALVRPFLAEMELALGAATLALSRAGASSLAEFAAVQVPALLIPYPQAADNHQHHNALAFVRAGAARSQAQAEITPDTLIWAVRELLRDHALRASLRAALTQWHQSNGHAAQRIAHTILESIPSFSPIEGKGAPRTVEEDPTRCTGPEQPGKELAALRELRRALTPATLLRSREPLASRTTLRVGGPADVYVEPASEADLARVLQHCHRHQVRWMVLGRGSNLLVKDGGFRGVVIHLGHPAFSDIRVEGDRLFCGAGARVKQVAAEARRHGLSGLEFLDGIPGSVGGALRMNAGAMGCWTFEQLVQVRFMDSEGAIHEEPAAGLGAEYRGCAFLDARVALAATFRSTPASPEAIQQRIDAFNRRRWATQPTQASAGCIFKNPPSIPAGRLVDELGLKGTRVGGAAVSDVHANFIVNDGTATAHDVLELIRQVRLRAQADRGIDLETEVEIVGEENA